MAGKVWVVLQQRDGGLHPMSAEAIAAGIRLAGAVGSEAEAILLCAEPGTAAEDARRPTDPHRFGSFKHEKLALPTPPEASSEPLPPRRHRNLPAGSSCAHSYQSVEFMPRLAQVLDAALVPEVVSFRGGDDGIVWTRPVFAGKLQAEVRVRGEGPIVVSVQSGAFPAERADSPAPDQRSRRRWFAAIVPDREILGVEEVAGEHVDLTAGSDHPGGRPGDRRHRQHGQDRGAGAKRWAPRSARADRSSTAAGCRATGRSAPAARRWRPSSTSPRASRGRFSTSSA